MKQEVEAEWRAVEAETARLRALRLEKEAADKADRQATGVPETVPAPPRRRRILSIKV